MKISICVPTLRRYDLLDRLIQSLRTSIVMPDAIYIIDNGGQWFAPNKISAELHFRDTCGIQHHYYKFSVGNLGLAASWNFFVEKVPEVRVICNDDILFTPNAIGALLDAYTPDAVVSPASIVGGNAFSCFILPDQIVRDVGLFDVSISPFWAYLEDNDYFRRMTLKGYGISAAPDSVVEHPVSSTLRAFSPDELAEHHRKFRTAQGNYRRKWGGLPGNEVFTTPYQEE
jgi:GT2 family glycosyltransferase